MDTASLLNAATETRTMVSFDRSYGGNFANPYMGAPSLTFYMQRIMVDAETGKQESGEAIESITEAFAPGKVYPLFNPSTGAAIPGATIPAETVYAALYAVMRAAILARDEAKAAEAARVAAIAQAEAARRAAQAEADAAAAALAAGDPPAEG